MKATMVSFFTSFHSVIVPFLIWRMQKKSLKVIPQILCKYVALEQVATGQVTRKSNRHRTKRCVPAHPHLYLWSFHVHVFYFLVSICYRLLSNLLENDLCWLLIWPYAWRTDGETASGEHPLRDMRNRENQAIQTPTLYSQPSLKTERLSATYCRSSPFHCAQVEQSI